MIEKIISGGQSGADLGGLKAARDAGIPTGGNAPKGWRICLPDGSDGTNLGLKEFGLVELESKEYPPRTRKNVADSDGTAIFGYLESPGATLTISTCAKMNKPLILNPTPEELSSWVIANNIKTLNVAGNRESTLNPAIEADTYHCVSDALSILES